MVNPAYCIDLYHGDDVSGAHDEGFALVKAAGIAFLDHKASQGAEGPPDSRCAFRRSAWMDDIDIAVTDIDGTVLDLKPKFGFYHFNGIGTAADEADHFMACVKACGYEPGDDLCLDWEDIGASGYQQSAGWADEFCQRVEQWCGFPLKVYGGDAPREQITTVSSNDVLDRFAVRRAWVCQYGAYNPSEVPLPWRNKGHMWQDDGDSFGPGVHRIPGLIGNVDNSTVVGGMTVLQLYNSWASA
jgi:hypothetical protein